MSTRVILAADQTGADRWLVFTDALDEPRGRVVYLELRHMSDATLTVVSGSAGALVEVGVPADVFWAMIRLTATARARAADLYPPLWLIRYDEPPTDATGRVRAERLDPDAARAADPGWAELAADRAPAASRLAGRLSGVAGTIQRAVDRAIREGVDPLAAVFAEALMPAPIHIEPGARPAVAARTAAAARELADLLRRAVDGDEPAAWETLTLTRVPALRARTLLETCAAGDADAVRDRLVARAEASALGHDHGEASPSSPAEAAVLDPSWALLADDAGTEDLRAVVRLARERAAEVLWLRSSVERALREGSGALAAACAEALSWGAPPAARAAEGRADLLAQGAEVARLLRVTLATDAGAVAWLLTRWSPRLRCTALEVLRRGDTDELRRMLDETAADADRFA